jgi:hypothetical protein
MCGARLLRSGPLQTEEEWAAGGCPQYHTALVSPLWLVRCFPGLD